MKSKGKIYSSFSLNWIVKSIPYSISYKKAFRLNEIDEIFCSIINDKGGSVDKIEFGELLGFNLSDEQDKGKYKDFAEEAVFNDYLRQVFEYNLIKEVAGYLEITEFGIDSLNSKLKYKVFYADVTLFENVNVKGELHTFSFKEVFDLKSKINLIYSIESQKLIVDSNLKDRLQYQVFEDDIFEGELLEVFESSLEVDYIEYDLMCQLIQQNNTFDVNLVLNGEEKIELNNLVSNIQNTVYREELIHKGKFYYILNSNTSIGSSIIIEFNDLWNWKELAENKNIDWSQTEIFNLFKENGDGSIWKSISENSPIEIIKLVIDNYVDYWDWQILTKRFEDDFIIKSIDKFKWDFNELSKKEIDFVIQLLTKEEFKNENWDWYYLSKNLPDQFIKENINTFPWNYYSLTTARFDVFKTVFNADVERQINNSWDWSYISKEINIDYLYQHFLTLSNRIKWEIVLERFFNDKRILNKCISDDDFKQTLKKRIPENFNIAHQKYLWSIEVISFFEDLNLINWETTSYTAGFDMNEYVDWNKDLFNLFSNKIISQKGIANISSLITDKSLLLSDFAWDWIAISKNKSIIYDKNFLSEVIIQPTSLIDKLVWSEIYPLYEITYWNENLHAFENNSDYNLNQLFWSKLTRDEEIGFILSNYHFPWNWSHITNKCSIDIIVESFEDENLIQKWDWSIATRKFDKKTIDLYLEECTPFWDWEYIITSVFSIEIELSFENGELARVASCLSTLEHERRQVLWRILTKAYPIQTLFKYINKTSNIDVFEWDWDAISAQKHLPTDLLSLNKFKNKFNWSILSRNDSIQRKFSYSNWGKDRKGCYDNIVKYLKQFREKWDWKVLSMNKDLNWDRRLLNVFKRQDWDWEYLSEHGKFLTKKKRDKDDYLINLLSQFPAIDFMLFSKRQDVIISSEVILSKHKENWDWSVLSSNPKAKISGALLISLSSEDWDWNSISERRDIDLINETIIKLIDKDWNWERLSSHSSLIFNEEFILKVKSKPWDWNLVSHHISFSPSIEILTQTKRFDLDWTFLSKRTDLNPTRELLSKFENYWDWHNITRQAGLDFTGTDLIIRFIDKWDWSFLSQAGKLIINRKTLSTFKDHLNWDLISSNTNIDFSKELIHEFRPFWNWNKLKQNNRILESLGDFVHETIKQSPILTFVDKIGNQYSPWGGSIYHFSHIENAVRIIKSRKIQSRNTADIQGDSAGNVVHRRSDAHDYARFYFRPHTPTQFYNEFLGKDMESHYWTRRPDHYGNWTDVKVFYYPKARNYGFPKCPIPIFFKFSLNEVLHKKILDCYMGNGNMQTNNAILGKFEAMINKMYFDNLFMDFDPSEWEDYLRFSQQEFLVKNELSFDDLIDFEIICSSKEDRELLISLIGDENKDVFSKIKIDSRYYNNENPRIRVEKNGSELLINSSFEGAGYLSLYPNHQIDSTNIKSGDIEKMKSDKLIFKSHLSLSNYNDSFKLTFTDESKREWFIHQII